MKTARVLLVSAVTVAAACGGDIAQPTLDDVSPDFSKNQRAVCRAQPLALGVTDGSVTTDDCVFTNADGGTQYEDLFLVNQGRLGAADGNTMATFSVETDDFNWIFGLGGFDGKEIFPTPVYAARAGFAGSFDWRNTISVIGGEPVYKMWVGGRDDAQLGDYTLTTSANPVGNVCTEGHLVYLQGDVSFSSTITESTACEGEVEFGPNIGTPLSFQYWYVAMNEGETVTLALDGVQDETVTAAIIDFGTGESVLDFSEGDGDTDRFVSFTAGRRVYLYVEVSMVRGEGRSSPYTATIDGPDTK